MKRQAMPTHVARNWLIGQPARAGVGGRSDAGSSYPTIVIEAPSSGSVAARLGQFLRSLPARNRSLRVHAFAPSLVSSALQESQPLFESGGLDDAIADGAGLVLPAAGAVVAAGSFGLALKDKWDATREASSSRAAQEEAIAVLAGCGPGAHDAAAKAALKRQCTAIGGVRDGSVRLPLYLAAHRAPLPSVSGSTPHAGAAADPAVAAVAQRRLEDELGRIDARRDRQIAAHCVDYLHHIEAANHNTRAAQSWLGSVLTCVRDVGIDVPSVGYDALSLLDSAGQGPLDLLLGAADAPSFGLGGAAGAMQVACGAFELRQARRQRRRLRELGMLVRYNGSRIASDGKRRRRIATPLARRVGALFERARRTAMAQAWRRCGLAWLRIGYGLLSIAASAAGAGMLLFFGAAMVAGTGGLALLAVSAVIGFSWVGVTGYKMVSRACGDSVRRDERQAVARALEQAAGLGLAAPLLAQCTLAQLEALPRHCPALQENRYLLSALLARRLIIDRRDRHRGKHERIETATLLQSLGMPRIWTTMLKRAPFDVVHRHIDAYLNDDMAVLALARGELAGMGTPPPQGG